MRDNPTLGTSYALPKVRAKIDDVQTTSRSTEGVSFPRPSSVIKGLMAAIGLILILKQIPHVLHHRNPRTAWPVLRTPGLSCHDGDRVRRFTGILIGRRT
jgi:hypothetical protein